MKNINEKRELNWGLLGTFLFSTVIWYFIFTAGFFITLTWLIVVSAIVGLWLRLTGRR